MSDGADRRLHPGTIALGFVKEAPQTILALPAAVAFSSSSGLINFLYMAAGLGVVLLAMKWLVWRRFKYGVGAAEIVIESGVLNRNRRSIPFDRVQDVDIERTFLARLLGLAKVRIETGAGGKDEGLLDSVSLAEAHRLREAVRAGQAGAVAAASVVETEAPAGRILFAMDPPRLILFGLFNFSLVYIAGLFALLQTFDRFLPFDIYDPARWIGLVDEYLPARWTLGAVAAVLLVAAALGTIAGVLRTVARDFGFRLSLEGDRLRREQGLFTRKEAAIPRRRVQLAQVSGGPLREMFGWSGLSFQTLGAGADRGGLQSAAPFATRGEIEAVLAEVPALRMPPPPDLIQVSRRHILRKTAGTLVPALLAIAAMTYWLPLAPALLALLPLLAAGAALERRFHRYALDGDMLFVARGAWRRRLWLVPVRSVQSLSLSRGPIQRRLGLATLSIDTAGASLVHPLRIVDLRGEAAEALAAEIARRRPQASGRKSGTER
ncbi:MAG TPA: PH domain-containing protein [Allosphingosinicella sp.]|jgi:putative membrane protein|nr:PH domain-containing protein [Allosphingosinicella sp.]